jgi:hypothetical protein
VTVRPASQPYYLFLGGEGGAVPCKLVSTWERGNRIIHCSLSLEKPRKHSLFCLFFNAASPLRPAERALNQGISRTLRGNCFLISYWWDRNRTLSNVPRICSPLLKRRCRSAVCASVDEICSLFPTSLFSISPARIIQTVLFLTFAAEGLLTATTCILAGRGQPLHSCTPTKVSIPVVVTRTSPCLHLRGALPPSSRPSIYAGECSITRDLTPATFTACNE